MKKTVWGNMIVKNEDLYLWFAVKSVINHLDKLLIWDTGSTDQTLEAVESLKKKYRAKIDFYEYGEVDEKKFTRARQKMLDQTKSDWLLIIDGDEVWWEESIKKVVSIINTRGDKLDLLVNPVINLVGDIYHCQEAQAGEYNLLDRKGHFNIRAINRKIKGLHVDQPYGQEGYFDGEGCLIQDRDKKRIEFVNAPYLHFTHLARSSFRVGDSQVMQRNRKLKYELGKKFPANFQYPQVLFLKPPEFVKNPWKKMTAGFKLRSAVETPLRKLKRRLKR